MLTLWNLFEASLLCLNAICILHEERFLAKGFSSLTLSINLVGWGSTHQIQGYGDQPTLKSQILNLVHSIRTVTRIPLIFFNIITIIFKLLLG